MIRLAITVITVALNAAQDLPLTIESVLGQTYDNVELMVVDGGSWDRTHDVLQRYDGRIDRIMTIEDGGIYQAMNFAATQAGGDFVLFLNAGDRFYDADVIETMVARRKGDPDVFFGDHVYVEGRVERFVRSSDFGRLRQRLRQGRIDHAWHTAIPCHQATFTRTRLLREMPYDTRYAICADHDFLLRACEAGARMQYIDEIVCHYVAGGMSASQGPRIHREWAHAYRKHSLRPLDVDSFFFHTAAASPFPGFNGYSGRLLSVAERDPSGETRWHQAGAVTLSAPEAIEAVGLHVKGAGDDPAQTVVFSSGERLLGAERPGVGEFEVRSAFIEPVSPGQLVHLTPDAGSTDPAEGPAAGQAEGPALGTWRFEALNFIPCATIERCGIDLFSMDPASVDDVFIDGWSNFGLDQGPVWSIIEQASVAFATPAPVRRLTIHCSGNAHAPGTQTLSVVVNGKVAGTAPLPLASEPLAFTLDVSDHWRDGANIIRMCVDQLSFLPEARRAAGFAVSGIEWEG